jgi:hypothetical protein
MVKIEHPFLFWFEEVDRRHNRLRERVKVSGDRLRHTSGMGQAIPRAVEAYLGYGSGYPVSG